MNSYEDIGDIVDKAKDGAAEGAGWVKDDVRNKAAAAWASALSIAKQVSSFVRDARAKGMDDLFSTMGFVRKPGMAPYVGSFAAGLVIGAGAGLLFAPKSGAETRHIIYRATNDLLSTTKDRLSTTKDKVTTVAKKLSTRGLGREESAIANGQPS